MKEEDVRNLARLARIAITSDEAARLTADIDGVLNYVGVIQDIAGDSIEKTPGPLYNVLREDVVTNEPGSYTETLLAEAPERTGQYVTVKKILNVET